MAKPEPLLRVNALGTVYINQEFSKVMPRGSVIVDISSNSAYALPKILLNKKTFALAEILQFNAVVESNIHARHLYERLGFVQLGTIPGGFRMKDGHYENICPYYHVL